MIGASSPIFTVLFARIFIKEAIIPIDLFNLSLVFIGILHIVKPPFIFGISETYTSDPEAIYAVIGWVSNNVLIMSNVYVLLRMLKGKKYYSIILLGS